MLGIRRRLVRQIRTFNRWWLDRLDPRAPQDAVPRAHPTASPPAAVRVTSEDTPNPDARKFVANVPIVPTGSLSFSTQRAAAEHEVGRRLFEIAGVRSIFATGNFLTVTRNPGADWPSLSAAVEAELSQILELPRG